MNDEQRKKANARCRAHYHRYPEKSKARRDESRRKNTEFVDSFKTCCCRCGNNDRRVLDFHHTGKAEKVQDVATLRRCGWSKKRIEEEIKKCIVVCANCHRILHWEERNEMQPVGNSFN